MTPLPVTQFRRKPTIIEAAQYFASQSPMERPRGVDVQFGEGKPFVVTIHNQRVYLADGDWILPEPDGVHFYPVRPEIFAATYEPASVAEAMSDTKIMQGRRIDSPFAADGGLIGEWPKPGDFYFYPEAGWCGVSPNGHLVGLRNHQVTEHEDGTISVSPSILVSSPGPKITETNDEMRYPVRGTEEWHGYLERGVWREL